MRCIGTDMAWQSSVLSLKTQEGCGGDFMFIVESGKLECWVKMKDGEEKMVKARPTGGRSPSSPRPPAVWRACQRHAHAAVPVPVPACGLCMPQKNERPSGSPTYLCRKKTSAFGLLAPSPRVVSPQ